MPQALPANAVLARQIRSAGLSQRKLCEALSMDAAGAGFRFLFIPWIALQKRPTFLLLLQGLSGKEISNER